MAKIPSSLLMLPRHPVARLEPIRPMTESELEQFLRDFSLEELRQVDELWQTYARRLSLIAFRANANHAKRVRLQS